MESKPLDVLGSKVLVRIRGEQTKGALSVVECIDEPGSGPPPHVHHREDELFHVLEGEYEIVRGTDQFVARKGEMIFAPRGVPHHFRAIGSSTGRLLVTLTPAGFEGFFEEVAALSREQQLVHVVDIGKKYGLEFVPPAGA